MERKDTRPRAADPPVTAAAIGRHYDDRSPIGDQLRDGQVHMWYWYDDEDTASLAEAVHRITRKVAETLGLRAGEHVLDAGCGPGQTAVFLAEQFGVLVTGVTVSRFELDRAAERARASGFEDRVRFRYGDYAALPFPEASFDAVLALESLQNATQPGEVLMELFRVLRPGGRLSFADFSLESADEPDRLARFMTTLKLTELPTLAGWLRYARAAGFEIEEYTQCGPRVYGRKARYLKAIMDHRAGLIGRFAEPALTDYSRKHQGFFVPRKHQIGYVIVAARKPAR